MFLNIKFLFIFVSYLYVIYMIDENALIAQLQNGIHPELKMKLIIEYRNFWYNDGFAKGWEDHTVTMRTSSMKIKEGICKHKNQLLDELRDEIWNIKNEQSNLQG